jgi:multiple sugar transport system substrate-binding protein
MQAHLNDLSQMAGAAGPIDWKTGKYDYANEHYVETLKTLLSFQKDGTLHPASSSLDARQGRLRWVAGESAMFFDGSWNSGVLANGMKDKLANIWVVPNPVVNGGGHVSSGPLPGTFWISGQSKFNKQATALLNLFTTDEFYIKLAERMDQPPLDLDAVAKANVDPTYKAVIAGFKDSVRLAPEPLIRNGDIGKVYAEMRTIDPSLGAIIQGAFAGAFDDPKPALQQYSDAMTAERDRAIKVVNGKGGKVSVDDWVFDKWSPDKDFTPDMY